jgi:hypothetical protein
MGDAGTIAMLVGIGLFLAGRAYILSLLKQQQEKAREEIRTKYQQGMATSPAGPIPLPTHRRRMLKDGFLLAALVRPEWF